MSSYGHKHILLVVRHPVGGIRTYFKYIYSQDALSDFRFTIIAPDEEFSSLMKDIFGAALTRFVPVASSVELASQAWSCLHKNPVDLVHSHGFTAGALTAASAIYAGVPHLMTAHDIFQEKQFAGFKGRIKRSVLSHALRRIDCLHTASQGSTENLMSNIPGLEESRLCLIPHGIDSERFFNAEPLPLHLEIDNDKALIGFFGRFMSPKGFRYLVDAIGVIVEEGLSNRAPLVLTFGEGGYIKEDYTYIEECGLSEYFMMMPYIQDMPGVIKSVDMIVMPSLWEACGLLAMEALVAGVPIIGTSCVGLREVLSGTPADMVPPGNSRALAKALALEMNIPRKKEFVQYSITAKKRFSRDKPASQLQALYLHMLSGKSLA